MEAWLVSGRLIDAILIIVAAEAVLLILLRRPGLGPVDIAFLLLPGVFLFAALRAALTASDWRWVALALTGALIFHIADVTRRLLR